MEIIQIEIEHDGEHSYSSNVIIKGYMLGKPQDFVETKDLLSLPLYDRKYRTKNKKAYIGYYNNVEDAKAGKNLQKIKLYIVSDIRCIGAFNV